MFFKGLGTSTRQASQQGLTNVKDKQLNNLFHIDQYYAISRVNIYIGFLSPVKRVRLFVVIVILMVEFTYHPCEPPLNRLWKFAFSISILKLSMLSGKQQLKTNHVCLVKAKFIAN